MLVHRKVSPKDVTEEPKMDDTNLNRLGTKAVLSQKGKNSYKHGVQQSPHKVPTIKAPTGTKEAGTEPSTSRPKPSVQERGLWIVRILDCEEVLVSDSPALGSLNPQTHRTPEYLVLS